MTTGKTPYSGRPPRRTLRAAAAAAPGLRPSPQHRPAPALRWPRGPRRGAALAGELAAATQATPLLPTRASPRVPHRVATGLRQSGQLTTSPEGSEESRGASSLLPQRGNGRTRLSQAWGLLPPRRYRVPGRGGAARARQGTGTLRRGQDAAAARPREGKGRGAGPPASALRTCHPTHRPCGSRALAACCSDWLQVLPYRVLAGFGLAEALLLPR